VKHLN